jgi:hypothetical protein
MTKTRDLANLIADSKVGPSEIDTTGTYNMNALQVGGTTVINSSQVGFLNEKTRVGTGATYPTDNAQLYIQRANNNPYIGFFSNDGSRNAYLQSVAGGNMIFGNQESGGWEFNNGTSGVAAISNSGALTATSAEITLGNSLKLQNVAGNGYATIQNAGAGTNTDLGFSTGGSPRMTITHAGNVSIGSDDDNPFNWGGSSNNVSITAAGSNDWAQLSLKGNGTGGTGINLGSGSVRHAGIFSLNGSNLAFATNPTNSGTTTSTAMTILSNGNVGINVSAPEHKLHVKSTSHDEPIALFEADTNGGGDVSIRLEGGGTGNPDEIYVEFSDRADPTNSFAIGLDDDASKLFLGYGALGTMNGHTQMVLQSDGKFGVNKTAPTSHLDVGADYTTNEGLFSVQRAVGYRFHRFNGSSGGATKTVTVNIKDYGLNAVEIIAHVTGHKYNSGPNAFAVKMVHVAMEESGNMRVDSDRTADLGYRIGNQQSKVGTMSVSSGSGGNLYATFTVHGEYDTRILINVTGAGFNYIASIAHS